MIVNFCSRVRGFVASWFVHLIVEQEATYFSPPPNYFFSPLLPTHLSVESVHLRWVPDLSEKIKAAEGEAHLLCLAVLRQREVGTFGVGTI